MKKLMLISFFVVFLVSCSGKIDTEQIKATKAVFDVPESVNYDQARNQLYVSNMNGGGTEENGKGYISILSPAGEIIEKKWVTGLNAPRGAGVHKNTLYVTDINRIVAINIDSAKIVRIYPCQDAKFLNDLAIATDGTVYFSDSSPENSAIYKIVDGEIEKWLGSEKVSEPNGLLIIDNYLYFGNSGDGKIKRVELETNAIEFVAEVGSMVDGLKQDTQGNFIVSDWKGKTSLITPPDKQQTILNTTKDEINSADLELLPDKNLVFIPTFHDNRVLIYRIKY